jgi:hypothetical protein
MADISNIQIRIGRLDGKAWVAATAHSPYFCIQADSKKALYAKLKKLTAFSKKIVEQGSGDREAREKPNNPFKNTEAISLGELEVA